MDVAQTTEAETCRNEDTEFEKMTRRFFEAEAECSDRLVPMERELLVPKTESFLALCDRLEKGEELTREPFIRILRDMEKILFRIPGARWQVLRSTVKKLIRVVDEDAGAYADSAKSVSEFILERKVFLNSEIEYPFSIENIKGGMNSGRQEKTEKT